MTYARRTDSTHKEVVEAFRKAGWGVLQTFRLGQSAPDLVVAKAGRVVAVEVKSARGRVKPGQAEWLAAWPGETAVVRGLADVLALTRAA